MLLNSRLDVNFTFNPLTGESNGSNYELLADIVVMAAIRLKLL